MEVTNLLSYFKWVFRRAQSGSKQQNRMNLGMKSIRMNLGMKLIFCMC